MEALSAVYGTAATWRRRWYARSPARTRHLSRPVISIGNLRVGGTGKTPAVACIARLLLERGERPAILSRGYRREKAAGGVTVVSTGSRVLADFAHAGDEPLLLARTLPGVPVLVCASRYAAGLRAEEEFAATVHLLDDGFQHVALARDVDLLLADARDLDDRVVPAGRLREPIANASVADAVLVPGDSADTARMVARRLGVGSAFRTMKRLGTPFMLRRADRPLGAATPVFAVAGIERPERFFDDARGSGLNVAGTMAFRDHHAFRPADVARIVAAARAVRAEVIVTTEKDAIRLEPHDLSAMPFVVVPLLTRIEPADAFADWLTARLERARAASGRARP
ncbi:MAG TPA: tetraacyldisaccharide 4'-kinase [Vicinamibacterales bacterium]|nr:tetraacyldisaccharide 4'-kinase [Vicinamibacterales bacterium]